MHENHSWQKCLAIVMHALQLIHATILCCIAVYKHATFVDTSNDLLYILLPTFPPFLCTWTMNYIRLCPTPEGNIGRLISQLSSCLQQVIAFGTEDRLYIYVGSRKGFWCLSRHMGKLRWRIFWWTCIVFCGNWWEHWKTKIW